MPGLSPEVWRVILAIVVAAHGIGHVLFLVPLLGVAAWGQSTTSWLLTPLLGDGPARAIGSLLFLAATIAFLATGAGMLGQTTWWRTLAVAASVVSLVGLLLFISGQGASPVLSAAVFDVLVVVSLLWLHWPSTTMIGR